MRGKNRSFNFFHSKKKIILLENFLCVFPLCRHSGGPKESSVHAEIDFRKHKRCFFLVCRCLLHCVWVLRYLLMRELMLRLADQERGTETKWKTPETQKHNHIGVWGSWPPKWPPVVLASWISHLMQSPPAPTRTDINNYIENENVWHLRLSYERLCSFNLLSWITCSVESQQSFCENILPATQKTHTAGNWELLSTSLLAGQRHRPPAPLQMTAAPGDILVKLHGSLWARNTHLSWLWVPNSWKLMWDECLLLL